MKIQQSLTIVGLALLALLPSGAVRALTFEKIETIDLAGVNLTMLPQQIESALKLSGYTEIANLAGPMPETKLKSFERIDNLLGDKEDFELIYDQQSTQSITYKHFYNQKTVALNWHDAPFAGEIEYALAILCDKDAIDPRDCKDAKIYKDGNQRIFTVEARRKGGYQRINLARFNATFEGFSWQVKRAGPFE